MRPEHGRLFSPESRASLAQAVLELARDRPLLARMGVAGRRFVMESDASWGAHAEKTLELYRSLI
jgi:glycosyltransferase involved in cell wall biosynthesis